MKKAFTLVELLVVIAVIAVLMAIALPSLSRVREIGWETACQNNLRQLGLTMKTYLNDHDGLFPTARYLYQSRESMNMDPDAWLEYPMCCRWHDERMAFDGKLLTQEHPELRGAFWGYVDNKEMMVCKVGKRANESKGCFNNCFFCSHRDDIPIVTQYTYTMNWYLGREITVGRSLDGSPTADPDKRTLRTLPVRRETQVTRSAAEVYLFGEENSWAVNTQGQQNNGVRSSTVADYDLSGHYKLPNQDRPIVRGALRLPSLEMRSTYYIAGTEIGEITPYSSDALATYHNPRRGDLNTGYSFVVMLDGHTRKVTVSDQLRQSRQVEGVESSELGPGGNVTLAWPLDIAPPGGWENQ